MSVLPLPLSPVGLVTRWLTRFVRAGAWGLGLCFVLGAATLEALALDPSRSLHQYNSRTWRRIDQLPSDLISALSPATDGPLWIGSARGLVEFDGLEFRSLDQPRPDHESTRAITALTPHSRGGVWLGTDRAGGGRWLGQRYSPWEPDSPHLRDATINTLLETRDGSLLIGTSNALLRRPSGASSAELIADDLDVRCSHEDTSGRLWIGTADHGLFVWQEGRITAISGPATELWAHNPITGVAVDSRGVIWVAAANGLHSLAPDLSPRPGTGLSAFITCLLVDRRDSIWAGTSSEGLFRVHGDQVSKISRRDGLASDHVLSLAETVDGSIWVGTDDGLTQLSEVKFPILSAGEGLASSASLSLAASPDGSVWIGTNDGLSHILDGQITNYGHDRRDGFRSTWIRRLLVARNGDLYVSGSRQELSRLRHGQVEHTWTLGFWTQSIAEDDTSILLTRGDKILRLVGDTLQPYLLADGTEPHLGAINRLLVARDGSLWIAANPGIHQIREGRLHSWHAGPHLASTAFLHLTEADDGAVWATSELGLVRVKNGQVSTVDHHQGLHSDDVRTMIADLHGQWWMDSDVGLFRVDQQELSAVADGSLARLTCVPFDGPHVVKSTEKLGGEYASCRSTDGRIWVSSAKGVTVIDPARLPTNSVPPSIHLSRVRVDGREYPVDRLPDLKPGSQNVEFTYTAIDFQAPDRVRYRYRLVGFQDDWVDAGNRRTAYFSSLPPGDYRFQVQACNADGVWNTTGASVSLALRPEPTSTWWFRFAAAGSLASLIAAAWIYRDRVRRRELAQIRHRERLQMEMIESSPVPMLMLDRDQRVLYANASFSRVFGYSAAELPDLATWWRRAWTDPSTLDNWARSWDSRLTAAAAAARSIEPVETTLSHKDSSLRYTAITTSAVGERTLVVCSDLTERKRAEEERLRLEEQLQQGQKMEAIGRLSGGIAHDFNNLLTVILGNISLLELDANYPPEAASSIRDIRHAAKRAANLTSQLLAFSRKQPLQTVDIDLNHVVREMTSMLQRIVGEDVRMEIHTPDTPLLTEADPTKLEQVVLNLVLNARDAMPSGGHLRVTTSIVDIPLGAVPAVLNARPGRFARLAVTDTGCGIHPELRPHLFEPFLTTKEVGKGTGLGLAIVFGIVEQHKGWVDVQSELMRGTTFSVYLPILASPTAPTPPADETVSERPPARRCRILLVEDDPGVRTYARKTLLSQGHQVFEAASGLLAIPLWTQHSDQIDLLFTDVVMPDGISGLELANHLQQEKPSLKVIYTSGYSAEIAEGAFSGRQGIDFLPKPYSPADLIRMIDRASAGLPPEQGAPGKT